MRSSGIAAALPACAAPAWLRGRGSRRRPGPVLPTRLSGVPFCAAPPLPSLQVRTPGGSQSPFYDELAKAAGDAEARGAGVHTKDKDAAAAAVRDLLSSDGAPPLSLRSVPVAAPVGAAAVAASLGAARLPAWRGWLRRGGGAGSAVALGCWIAAGCRHVV